jgi:hypothetical protein
VPADAFPGGQNPVPGGVNPATGVEDRPKRTATALVLVAIGAILAFAVTTSPSFLNLQVTGWVIMLTGVAGVLIPRRGSGWLRRRVVVRRPRGAAADPSRAPRALGIGRVFHRVPGPGTPPAGPAPAAESTVERTVPGTAEPAEETVEEYYQD